MAVNAAKLKPRNPQTCRLILLITWLISLSYRFNKTATAYCFKLAKANLHLRTLFRLGPCSACGMVHHGFYFFLDFEEMSKTHEEMKLS